MMCENEKYIDLHIHTNWSDGKMTVEEMLEAAKEEGLTAISITDHNCFAIKEPIVYEGMEVIPGAEISTIYTHDNGQKTEVHILSPFFEGVDPELESMFAAIDKSPYMKELFGVVNDLGFPVTMEELKELYPEEKQFGRYKLAELLVKKGYAETPAEAMDKWIGNNSPYYLNPANYVNFISIEECIKRLCSCHAPVMPILAHPFHYKFSLEQVETMIAYVRSLTDHPLALEVYYGKYNDDEIRILEKLADKYGYYLSAGGDKHRAEQPFVHGGYCLLKDMKKAVGIGEK